jgi:sporulation protein YlmC with PRC-barrel domain
MSVIDSDGKLVGTIKDVGFVVGKAGISLNVEGKDGQIRDIGWDAIQGAADFVVLRPTTQSSYQATQPVQMSGQPNQAANQPACSTCRGPLTYIPQYQRWYCYNCKKYA